MGSGFIHLKKMKDIKFTRMQVNHVMSQRHLQNLQRVVLPYIQTAQYTEMIETRLMNNSDTVISAVQHQKHCIKKGIYWLNHKLTLLRQRSYGTSKGLNSRIIGSCRDVIGMLNLLQHTGSKYMQTVCRKLFKLSLC